MRSNFLLTLLITLVLLAGLIVAFRLTTEPATSQAPKLGLKVYCAAGIIGPVDEAIKDYAREYQVEVLLDSGGSGDLLARIETSRLGDLFIAADDDYLDKAEAKGLVAERFPLAEQRAVIAVAKGNPKQIKSLESLLEPNIRLGLGNPDTAAVGKISKKIFDRAGIWAQIKQAVEEHGVMKPTVPDLANDLKLGHLDAAIVWDSTVAQYPQLQAVPIDEALNEVQHVTLGVLNSSQQPTQSLHLARYLSARDKGLVKFRSHHYQVADGDAWAERPELTLYIGGMLRPAVEATIEEFKSREGVDVRIEYNGCGILVAMMKTTREQGRALPDAYFACDRSFMTQVEDVFPGARDQSQTRIIICVPLGNPRNIKSLADLQQADLKVGVCNAEQSALGALTKTLLESKGLYEGVMKNVVVQVPTADLLITQLRAGGLDAAIVYEVNYKNSLPNPHATPEQGASTTTSQAQQLEPIRLQEEGTLAVQPLGVWKDTKHKQLVGRLIEAIHSAKATERFTSRGFDWLDQQPQRPNSPNG